jgi:hypothetical protein
MAMFCSENENLEAVRKATSTRELKDLLDQFFSK